MAKQIFKLMKSSSEKQRGIGLQTPLFPTPSLFNSPEVGLPLNSCTSGQIDKLINSLNKEGIDFESIEVIDNSIKFSVRAK